MTHRYVIIGGGVAGASAVEGIRMHDPEGDILMFSRENHAPYRRPLLSKDLWYRPEARAELPVHDDSFYRDKDVQLMLRREIVELEPASRTIWDDRGVSYTYDQILLATGAKPRELVIEGSMHPEIHYFRTLEDYLWLERRIEQLQHVLIIGADPLAAELAAALRHHGREVTWVFPHDTPLHRILPRDIGEAFLEHCREVDIEVVSNDMIAGVEDHGGLLVARTQRGNTITTQMAIVANGSLPQIELAEAAGLETGVGIQVDQYARTTAPGVYAAGDVAEFPYIAVGRPVRLALWDHAVNHGRTAGANMAGAGLPYTHMPLFFGKLFDVYLEAVGQIDTNFDTQLVWLGESRECVVFYLEEDVVRGIVLWNLQGKSEWARELIRDARPMSREEREALVATAVKS